MTRDSQPAAINCEIAARISASSSGMRTAPDASTRSETSSRRLRGNDRDEAARHAIGLRPRSSAKLDHVAKAARGDHAGFRQPALQHRVGGGGRAVHDQVDAIDRKSGRTERRNDAEGLVVDRGRSLGDMHPATVTAVDQKQVGEGSADIDAGDDAAQGIVRLRRKILFHCRNPKCPDYGYASVWKGVLRCHLDANIICILINSRHKSLPLGSVQRARRNLIGSGVQVKVWRQRLELGPEGWV